MREFRPFSGIQNDSDAIKAHRWLSYWIMGIYHKEYRLELQHYRHCGEFINMGDRA